jgi:hypothetical protein
VPIVLVPLNIMCSKKWLMPVMPGRSLTLPTFASQPAEIVFGWSWRGTRMNFIPLSRTKVSASTFWACAGATMAIATAVAARRRMQLSGVMRRLPQRSGKGGTGAQLYRTGSVGRHFRVAMGEADMPTRFAAQSCVSRPAAADLGLDWNVLVCVATPVGAFMRLCRRSRPIAARQNPSAESRARDRARRAAFPGVVPIASCIASAVSSLAAAQLRIANYNVAQLKGDTGSLADVIAAMATDDKPGFAVAPHILVFQEVRAADITALDATVNGAIPGVSYVRATYTTTPTEDGAGGAQALFYRADTVTEIVSAHKDLATGASRKSDRWQLQLVGYTSNAAKFYIYASHLKASPGSTNEAERLAGAEVIRADADALPEGTHILYCGDFNLYSNTEPAYLEYLSAGAGQAFDPLGTGSWSGAGNAIKHSQSPRDIVADGLVGGGMDDRFDFQLSTSEMQDGNGLSVIGGTYRSFGNDGQHYDTDINNGNNTYWPDDVAGSNALADALFAASDHIPVLCDYQIPAVLHATMPPSVGKIIRFTPYSVPVSVSNIAAGSPLGIDTLDVQVAGTGALSGNVQAVAPLAPNSANVLLPLSTGVVGPVTAGATVTALSEGTQGSFQILATTGNVVRPSNGSFSSSANVDVASIASEVEAGTAGLIQVPIFNFQYDANQALLDIDLVSGLSGRFSIAGPLPENIGALGNLNVAFDAVSAAPGTYHASLTLFTSDEDIPGETDGELVLDLTVTVTSDASPADINGDGNVDGADLGQLLGAWSTPGPGDINGDGIVDGADLAILLGEWS